MKKLITKTQFIEDYKSFKEEIKEVSRFASLQTTTKKLGELHTKMKRYLTYNVPMCAETPIYEIHGAGQASKFVYRIADAISFMCEDVDRYGYDGELPKIKHIPGLNKNEMMKCRNIGKATIEKMEEIVEMAELRWENN